MNVVLVNRFMILTLIYVLLQTFQRQVHESLTQLELINKQYQRLARENRTDASCSLREMAHDANQRWDNLQRRVPSVLRRLKVQRHLICFNQHLYKYDSHHYML